MVSAAELAINRKNTKAFIDADPVQLVLLRRVTEDMPDGGYRLLEPEPQLPQTFRLIPQTDVMPQVQTPDGMQLLPGYVLLGEHDANMARWDKFTLDGVNFMIVSPIRPQHSLFDYERKGDVARY